MMSECTALAVRSDTTLVVQPERARREPKARVLFDPQPVSDNAVRALREEGIICSGGDVNADEAAQALKRRMLRLAEEDRAEAEAAAEAEMLEAMTPQQLPFSLPPRIDRPAEPLLMLTCQHPTSSDATSTEPMSPEEGLRTKTRKRRATPFSAGDDAYLQCADSDTFIDVVSEYSGIGALEHGLHAGFDEAGLTFRLIEACDTHRTKEGRHASAVLNKRFPDCLVLNPDERKVNPYPATARIVNVTAQCTEHSGLNVSRQPWVTETEFLEPVLRRLEYAPQVECVILENVPNFAKTLDGQDRSSYSMWVEGLIECGFSEHAYVILPTKAAGDLHQRVRLLSVHTRGAFHPAAALMRLLDIGDDDSEQEDEAPSSAVFSFTTGLSEGRAHAKGGVGPTYGALCAYNTNLNLALYVRGAYYRLCPWLASRCSGLPDDYQSVWDFSNGDKQPRKQPLSTCLATALGNMVSPLQARELGYAVASEWLDPRKLAAVTMLEGAQALPLEYQGNVPYEFPTARAEATLCFSSTASGRWHRITGRAFHRVGPTSTLDRLCDEALRRGELTQHINLCDLNRVVDDSSLESHHRRAAAQQYERIQRQANEEMRNESQMALQKANNKRGARGGMQSIWAQCDSCLQWRRLTLPPAGVSSLPERWLCSMNPNPPFNRCDAPEEEMADNEVSRDGQVQCVDDPFTAEADRWLVAMSDRINDSFGWDAAKREQLMSCSRTAIPFSPLCFDHYFKSRTTAELEARAAELKRRRSGTLVLADSAESPQPEASAPTDGVTAMATVALKDANVEVADEDEEHDGEEEVGEEAEGEEEEEEEDAQAAEILRHYVYGRARPGSLFDVYVHIRYVDGSITGGMKGAMEDSEFLCSALEGPDVLAAYCRTTRGASMTKYVPQNVLEAGELLSDLECARRAGALSAVRTAATIRADIAEVERAKRRKAVR